MNENYPTYVAVDEMKICRVIEEHEGYYLCSGQIGVFKISKDRAVKIDDEYAVILNLYGITPANNYAKEKGYLK